MKKNFLPLSFFLTLSYLCSCNNSNTAKTQSQASTEPELKSIFINGDSLHYIGMGKGDPVVFIHGALSDYRTWRLQMDTFAKNHRVIAYSRRYAWPNQQTIIDSSKLSFAAGLRHLVILLAPHAMFINDKVYVVNNILLADGGKPDSVQAAIGSTVIKIKYSRPSMRGSVIFGEVVPWNHFCRAGANAADKVSLSALVFYNNQELYAGEYSIFTMPAKDGWTIP